MTSNTVVNLWLHILDERDFSAWSTCGVAILLYRLSATVKQGFRVKVRS